ncbi:MAG: Lrp/AsnC ligand binding domain-containing protein [Patulibacter sp.]|nr:Lrp/AsnC ligand binding domain-containing protein [Patulibacter sp.]
MATSTAFVLVQAEKGALADLGGRLADVEGVSEAYSVTGDWDYVVIVRLGRTDDLARVVTSGIASVDGVARTQTMMAFEAFSRHDLDALFDIGG